MRKGADCVQTPKLQRLRWDIFKPRRPQKTPTINILRFEAPDHKKKETKQRHEL